jgi:hypothetical protein
MVFRIRDIDWSEASGERIELGLGTFRSLDFHQRCIFDVVPIEPCLWCGVKITHPPDGGMTLAGLFVYGSGTRASTGGGRQTPAQGSTKELRLSSD